MGGEEELVYTICDTSHLFQMQGDDCDSLKLVTVGRFTLQKLANTTNQTFPHRDGLPAHHWAEALSFSKGKDIRGS